jgi:broad specificity phosphatase PhoE
VPLCLFTRHAEATVTANHTLNGDPQNRAPLTARGRWQARRLGDQLRFLQIDVALCTRHRRTRETAEIALQDRSEVELVEWPAFDEINFGSLEGRPLAEYAAWFTRHETYEPFPRGESYAGALARFAEGLDRLRRIDAERTLVVCHALPLRCILEAASQTAWRSPHRSVGPAVPYLLDDRALSSAAARLTRLAARSLDLPVSALG